MRYIFTLKRIYNSLIIPLFPSWKLNLRLCQKADGENNWTEDGKIKRDFNDTSSAKIECV